MLLLSYDPEQGLNQVKDKTPINDFKCQKVQVEFGKLCNSLQFFIIGGD